MEDRINYKKIARYLAGECTRKETREIERRMKNDPEYAGMVHEYQKIWMTKKSQARAWDIEGVWEKLARKMGEESEEYQQVRLAQAKTQTNRRGSGVYWIARIAAILLVVGLSSLFTVLYLKAPVTEEVSFMKEVVTEHGQRATIQLSDGSRIRLNSGSTLQHPEEFNEERTVHLSGEAYFEIARDGRPFFVQTDNAQVEVLGTEFNVQAFENEENMQVVVAGGKVAVRPGNQTESEGVRLEPGDMATLHRENGEPISVSRGVDVSAYLGWMDYRLTFDDTSMAEAARKLERWYGVDITFLEPSIAGLNVSATFEDESIREVLRVIDIALNLDHNIEGRSITFSRDE